MRPSQNNKKKNDHQNARPQKIYSSHGLRRHFSTYSSESQDTRRHYNRQLRAREIQTPQKKKKNLLAVPSWGGQRPNAPVPRQR